MEPPPTKGEGERGKRGGSNNDAGDNRAVRNSNYIALDNVIERPDQCDFRIKLAIVIFERKWN